MLIAMKNGFKEILNKEWLVSLICAVVLATVNIFILSLAPGTALAISVFILSNIANKMTTTGPISFRRLFFIASAQAVILFAATIIVTCFLYYILQIRIYDYTSPSFAILFLSEFILFLFPYLLIVALLIWKNTKSFLLGMKSGRVSKD
jgi:hypothetical protein